MLIKKYGNRRLYDTGLSRYITLEDLAEIIRAGEEVRVVDAKTDQDLTTATLAQIIVEGRGAARLLPAPLLVQLIRMGDDALAEFFGQYVTWALEVYLTTRQGTQALTPYSPFFSRMFGVGAPPPPPPQPAASPAVSSDVAALRREVEALKKSLKKRGR